MTTTVYGHSDDLMKSLSNPVSLSLSSLYDASHNNRHFSSNTSTACGKGSIAPSDSSTINSARSNLPDIKKKKKKRDPDHPMTMSLVRLMTLKPNKSINDYLYDDPNL